MEGRNDKPGAEADVPVERTDLIDEVTIDGDAPAKKKVKPRKRATKAKSPAATKKTKAAPRKRAPKVDRVTEVAQAVGADVVPHMTIEVDSPRKERVEAATTDNATADTLLSDWDYHLF